MKYEIMLPRDNSCQHTVNRWGFGQRFEGNQMLHTQTQFLGFMFPQVVERH